MTSVKYRNPEQEEEKLELRDEFYDYNINYKINICTKGFFDKIIKNVLFDAKERTSLLKKGKLNRFSVSNETKNIKKDCIDYSDFSNKCNKESRKFLFDVIKATINKIKNEKLNLGQNGFFFNNFEFHKSNINNVTVTFSKKFLEISIKNCFIKFNKANSFLENRKSLEINFFQRRSKIQNKFLKKEKEDFKDLNHNKSFKNAAEFLNKTINFIIGKLNPSLSALIQSSNSSQLKNIGENDIHKGNLINNRENENFKFTENFFSEKVRNTVTQIYIEKESLDSKFNAFTKSFFNDKIRQTVSSINTKEATNETNNFTANNASETIELIRGSINSLNKSQNMEPVKTLSSQLNKQIDKKFEEEEISRKNKLTEQKLVQEKLEIEKEIELGKIRNASNSFWNKSFGNTMTEYNLYYQKLVKNVIKIQSNFRMNLWRFIMKIELMNLQIQKENEKAMAASCKRRKSSLTKPLK